jgi:hypothetical protein
LKTYRVKPFEPVITERVATKEGSAAIARQLEELLNLGASEGWQFESYQRVDVGVRQGCLSMGGVKTVLYSMLVFSKEQ